MRFISTPRITLIVGALCGVALIVALALLLIDWGRFHLIDRNEAGLSNSLLGRKVYEIHCAICHGRYLEGQINWQTPMSNGHMPAPPHNASGHTWHHPDDVLIRIVTNGLKPYAGEDYESDMPAFAGTLSDQQIEAVVAYIKSTWPERERGYQAAITRQARGLEKSQ
jgi:mono/diheme cytochrome c family protein